MTERATSTSRRKQQRSFVWTPEPGDQVAECPDCGPFWYAEFETDLDGGIALREWHRDRCWERMDAEDAAHPR